MSDPHSQGTALITGASSGIGKVYADRLARRGYDLILVARDKARLDQLAGQLAAETGAKADVIVADLTEKAGLARVEQRLRNDESITLLVNNAGVAAPSALVGADLDRLESLIQLNIVAFTRLAGAAADAFVPRKRGVIINISSVLALLPERSGAAYSGSKAYVLNFTQSLNQELAPYGIRVQAVLPGATRTEIWERSGTSVDQLPPEIVMEVDEMVDAALAGFDRGELVTIPSLPDAADWAAFSAARLALGPNLSRNHAADRYKSADEPTAKPAVYLDDIKPGDSFTSGSLTVDETQIKAFAAKFDPQPFHLDGEAAEKTLFGGLAASGWHTAALTMRLLVGGGAPFAGGVIGAGGEISWPKPTRPGDTLTVTSEVVEVTPSKSRPDRGMATVRSRTTNQNGEAVQVSTMKLVVPRRAVADAA